MTMMRMLTPLLAAAAMTGVAATPAAAQVVDGSFETQGTASLSGSSSFCFFSPGQGQNCAAGAWTGAGRSGIASNGGGGYQGTTPAGNDYAFIQSNNGFGAISQSVTLGAGSYLLSFLVGGRQFNGGYDGDTSYSVLVDNVSIFSGRTVSNMAFTAQTAAFNVLSGSHTLTFQTATASGDNTAFIDRVAVSAAVPEAATWAMMIVGFGAAGYAMRTRRRRSGAVDARIANAVA